MKKIIFILFAVVQSFISLAQPANDDPCGALLLTVQTGSACTPANPFSWTGATGTAGIPDPGCGSYSTGDIWFSFIAPLSGAVNINTTQGSGPGAITDGAMAVYGNPAVCSVLSFFLYACDDDSGPGLMPALSITGLLPGIKYYIRFWDFGDLTAGNIGGICLTDPYPPLATTGAVGIGIQNPDNLLDVNGPLKIRGGNPGLNKVLTSDASGLASWTNLVNPVPFKASVSSSVSIPSGPFTAINFNSEEYDAGGNFSSGIFTAPVAGIYHFDATISWSLSGITSPVTLTFRLGLSGTSPHPETAITLPAGSTDYSHTISTDLSLTASQTVQVFVSQNSGSSQTVDGNFLFSSFTFFSGHRIQ
jgi:hypothetical protein